jgi:hypothetical protein
MSGTATADNTADDDIGPDADADIEARAMRMGWVPRDKFRGRAEKWTTAAENVERGERMLPLLQERNRTLDQTVARLQREQEESTQALRSLVERTRKAEKVGYDRAVRELNEKRDDAIKDGDVGKVREIEAAIAEIPKPEPEPPKPDPNATQPPDPSRARIVQRWVAQNGWFNTDLEAKNAAIAALSIIEQQEPDMPLEEQLGLVRDRVKKRFPEHFEADPKPRRRAAEPEEDEEEEEPVVDRRSRPARVSPSGSAATSGVAPRSFLAMPKAAQREWERQANLLKGKGEPLTKEEYARYYWEAEGE